MEKEQILDLVKEYYKEKHIKSEYQTGDRINYAGRVYDEEEMCNLVDSALDFWLTAAKYTTDFENGLAAYQGLPYCSLVNSGSSANLLAVMALTSRLLGDRRLKRGDEIITVAAAFPTTVAPILQAGAVPVFVDIAIPSYNLDVAMLEKALTDKTKAVFIAHSLGNIFDLKTIREFCNQNDLWMIEDNCDGIGGEYVMNGQTYLTGTVGDIGTSSFYPAHQMTMGEGGALYTRNALLHKIIRSMRDWGRDCVCAGGQDDTCHNRFTGQYGTLPYGYDHKYVYSHIGYNMKATDMQAAIGVAQLKKLPEFVKKRRANWEYLKKHLEDLKEYFILPEKEAGAEPCWFGFILYVREESGKTKDQVVSYLEKHNIQTRSLFAGNILRQPCFDGMVEGQDYRIIGTLTNTDLTMKNAFWVGVYPGMQTEMLEEIVMRLRESVMV